MSNYRCYIINTDSFPIYKSQAIRNYTGRGKSSFIIATEKRKKTSKKRAGSKRTKF